MLNWFRKKPDPERARLEAACREICETRSGELLPCPFCGSGFVRLWFHLTEAGYAGNVFYDWTTEFYASCDECDAQSGAQIEPEWVIEAWNKRYEPKIITSYSATTVTQ